MKESENSFSGYKTVSEVNTELGKQFYITPQFRSILVKGEVTNYKGPNNGNYYFEIKDDKAMLPCMIKRDVADRILKFKLESGKEVAIKGDLGFYNKTGTNRLYVNQISDMGAGQAAFKYMQLKKKLEEEGLFDQDHKKAVNKFSKCVGIVTSKDGQAIKDITKVAKKRNPYVQLVLYHVNVQGIYAVNSIVEGIKALDDLNFDALIVGRGGGSDEDLSAFNDEKVARAVYAAKTPIISAVGHEGNWALIDYVSDKRVATPSEAAEETIPDVMTVIHRVEQLKKGISDNMQGNLRQRKYQLEKQQIMLDDNIRNNFRQRKYQLDKQKIKLEANNPARVLKEKQDRFQVLYDGLDNKIVRIYDTTQNRYRVLVTKLNGLSPTAKLINGFGYISLDDKPVKSVRDVNVGDEISIRIHDGRVITTVNEIAEA